MIYKGSFTAVLDASVLYPASLRDRELSPDEIRHYQKIIVALMETDRIMSEFDEIKIE